MLAPMTSFHRLMAAFLTAGAVLSWSLGAGADEVKGRIRHDLVVGTSHDVQLKTGQIVQVLKRSGETAIIMAPAPDGSSGIYQIEGNAVEVVAASVPAAVSAPAASTATNAVPASSTVAAAPVASTTSPSSTGAALLVASAGNSSPAAATASGSAGQLAGFAADLKGHLVTLQNGQVVNFDASQLQGVKYWAIYFSASWCPDCVPVTPELVRFYREFKTDHPNFELIMVCHDKTEAAMHAYIKKDEMPWPALRFSDVWNQKLWPLHYIAKGIPNLVLVDGDGKVLSQTFDGIVDRGTDKVMDEIKTLVPVPEPQL